MTLPAQRIKLPGIKKMIAVLGSKGGVGSTFVASTLALTLAKSGQQVGLLDANISSPTLFQALGITTKLRPTGDHKLIPAEKWGLKVISMAGLCESEDEPLVWRGPIISKIIQKFLKETLWGELDFLIIDVPTGASDALLTILQQFAVTGMLLVVSPQQAALRAALRIVNMAKVLNVPLIGIVENFRGDVFGEGGGARLAETSHIPFLGSIPMRKQIAILSDQGTPPIFHIEELEIISTKIAKSLGSVPTESS